MKKFSTLASGRPVVEHARLDDLLVHVQLEPGRGQDSLLDGVDHHETQNSDLVLLPDSVSPILGLEILVRVPIGVEDDDRVGGLQVQPETSGSSGEQEDEVLRVGTVENPQLKRKRFF